MTNTEQAVAWLIQDGEDLFATNEHGYVLEFPSHSVTPLFTRQQVIEELANKAEVMPEVHELGMDFDKGWDGVRCYGCKEEEVREAIAAMQAKIDLLEGKK